MYEKKKQELKAVGMIALGSARIASGIATALGKGLLGAYCRNHHMTHVALKIAQNSVTAGTKMIGDGWKQWNDQHRPPGAEPSARS